MIIGIEGGIGTGKSLSMVYFALEDLSKGKRIITNIRLKDVKKYENKITYLTKDSIKNIFELVKERKLNMTNTTLLLDEAHNYLDSRNSMSVQNKVMTYFILQSRHFGEGTGCIIWNSQSFNQVDLRLRRNTDYFLRPTITGITNNIPSTILIEGNAKIGHKWTNFIFSIDVRESIKKYDTHEIVDF